MQKQMVSSIRRFVSRVAPIAHPARPCPVHAGRSPAHCRQVQSGFATLVIVSMLAILSLSVISISSLSLRQSLWQQEERMANDVNEALEQLRMAYERQWQTLAGPVDPAWDENRMRLALSKPIEGMRMAMSQRITTDPATLCATSTTLTPNCIPSRQIMLWFPATTAINNWTLTRGLPLAQLGADAIGQVYDTRTLELERYAQTQAMIDRVGFMLTTFFKARAASDPRLGGGINWWRRPTCSSKSGVGEHYLPCVNTYTSLVNSSVTQTLGLSRSDVETPYGAIEFSNLEDANLTTPFTVALRVQTPFGVPMRKKVIAP